ncbi:hypothetical protein [Ferrovibrio sp.]|uniref:hypothetical protein n=1 Tax=Ferrovibrio sp. TaxID=1917215 RepID=UPI00351109B5
MPVIPTGLRVAAFALLLMVTAGRAAAEDISGFWYGEGYQGRGYLQWLSERRPDGSFFVEFRQYKECQMTFQQKEAGRWKLEGNIYSTATSMIDGERADYADRYQLESVIQGVMKYKHLKSGHTFTTYRVGDDFRWPTCDPAKLVS